MKQIYLFPMILSFLMMTIVSTQAENYHQSLTTMQGMVMDKQTLTPLIGAVVQLKGTSYGAVTDMAGHYQIDKLPTGKYVVEVRFLTYKTMQTECNVSGESSFSFDFAMEPDAALLKRVTVIAKKNLESEQILLVERASSVTSVENIGSAEMSQKGLSNASEGVAKLSGIAIADESELIVRGLGDRYSMTTLNGLPIASPNPDNKLIPLDLFSSSMIKNITVTKVYDVANFADYSGALVDIATKENLGQNFLNFSLQLGGQLNTLFQNFYQDNKRYGLWGFKNISPEMREMTNREFVDYAATNDPFGTTFGIKKNTSLPDIGGNISLGRIWNLKRKSKLDLLTSFNINHKNYTVGDEYEATINAQGVKLNYFYSNSYTSELNITGLAAIGLNFRTHDRIAYTFFYTRNAVDDYKIRDGYDEEGIHLIGSNSVTHIYSLLNNQLKGVHHLGNNWQLSWSGSYGLTSSDEPDRRQVMYRYSEEQIKLFTLNKQETMRYFGNLKEQEMVGDIRSRFQFGKYKSSLQFGATYKHKVRNYISTRFYYDLTRINPNIASIEDIYNADNYINQESIECGDISIVKDNQPRFNYYAGNDIAAAFAKVNLIPVKSLLLDLGLRFEQANYWVQYWNDASMAKISNLNSSDFFPSLNLKYTIKEIHILRFAFSRTVTRPSFIEMAPFLYKESYGSAEVRGNENLQNGYNYNIDLRYELFPKNKIGFLSIGTYYKYLLSPIERVQESAGGSAVHSFRNADNGMAAGLELEGKVLLFNHLKIGLNASYIFTDVLLPNDGGIYTDVRRPLQGASPYLLNADAGCLFKIKEKYKITISLLYNLQGPCIHAVGIYGVGNEIQQALHTLNVVTHFDIGSHCKIKLKLDNLLNNTIRYTQKIVDCNVLEVKNYKPGMGVEIGVTYNFE